MRKPRKPSEKLRCVFLGHFWSCWMFLINWKIERVSNFLWRKCNLRMWNVTMKFPTKSVDDSEKSTFILIEKLSNAILMHFSIFIFSDMCLINFYNPSDFIFHSLYFPCLPPTWTNIILNNLHNIFYFFWKYTIFHLSVTDGKVWKYSKYTFQRYKNTGKENEFS